MLRAALALAGLLVGPPAMADDGRLSEMAWADIPAAAMVVDARPLDNCLARSVKGARCIPMVDLLGPDGRLANFRDILWLLGTAGLDGREEVAVIGAPPERDALAAVLYLAGQARVTMVGEPVAQVLAAAPVGPGAQRGMVRDPIFVAVMRDGDIVLPGEAGHGVVEGRPLATGPTPAAALARCARLRAGGVDAAVLIAGVPAQASSQPDTWPVWSIVVGLILATMVALVYRRAECLTHRHGLQRPLRPRPSAERARRGQLLSRGRKKTWTC